LGVLANLDVRDEWREGEAAIIPVDEAEAKKKHWGDMPLPDLIAALEKKAPGMVLRTDQEPVNRATNVVIDEKYFEVIL